MKRVVKVVLLICIICILFYIPCSRINEKMMTVEQYAFYSLNLIWDTKYDLRNSNTKQALVDKGYVIFSFEKIYNLDKLYEFCSSIKAKKKSSVRAIVDLSANGVIIYDFKYNGRKVELIEDHRRQSDIAIASRKVVKSKYDDFITEGSGAYGSYYLISDGNRKEFWPLKTISYNLKVKD